MSRRWWKIAFASAVAISALLAPTLRARTGIVHTIDNSRFTGDITEQGQYLVITVHGIETRIDKRNVARVEYTASFDEQFTQRHAVLAPDDVKGRQALADFALQNGRPDLAMKALNEASAIAPTSREVALQLESAQKQLELDRSGHQPYKLSGATSAPATAPTTAEVSTAANSSERRLLNLVEINRIRQDELPPDDAGVRVRFDNNVAARFVKATNRNLAEFRALSPVQQAETILAEGDSKLADDVHYLTDPAPITAFKNKVLPIIMSGCASAGCHGGEHAGSFGLYTGASPDVLYTNFYILQTYAKAIRGTQYMAMDRNYPQRSLVLQFGIPANQALVTHPAVNGYRPRFSGTTDPAYQVISTWLSGLRPIEPQYGITVSSSLPTPSSRP